MAARWISVLSCALISLLLAAAANAQTRAAQESSTAPAEFRLASTFSQSSSLPATRISQNLDWKTETPIGSAANLTASATESDAALLGAPGLWTAENTIRLSTSEKFDAGNDAASAGPDTSNCRWTMVISNAWSCEIKHLGRYDLPIHHAVQHLWPLHKDGNQ